MKACILIIEDCDINDLKELINTLENKTLKDEEIEILKDEEIEREEIKTINQENPKAKKTKTSNNKKRKYVIEGLDF